MKKVVLPSSDCWYLKKFDEGKSTDEITRDHLVSKVSLYKWRQLYASMEASELKRIIELEDENARLKRMYTNLALELDTGKYIIYKKLLSLVTRNASLVSFD